MKIILDKKPKREFSYHMRNSFRNILIILSYTLGFCLYAFIYLVWTIDCYYWVNILSYYKSLRHFIHWEWGLLNWIIIPILGFILGICHMFFIYKGSLFCKALIMFSIMFYTFILPVVIAFVN